MTPTGIDHPPFQLTRNGLLTRSHLAEMRTAVLVLDSDDDRFLGEVMKLVRWIDAATAIYKFIILSPSRGGKTDGINVLEEHAGRDVVRGILDPCGTDLHWATARRAAPPAVQDAMRGRNAYVLIGLPAPSGPMDAIDYGEIKSQIAEEFLANRVPQDSRLPRKPGFLRRREIRWRDRYWRRLRRQS